MSLLSSSTIEKVDDVPNGKGVDGADEKVADVPNGKDVSLSSSTIEKVDDVRKRKAVDAMGDEKVDDVPNGKDVDGKASTFRDYELSQLCEKYVGSQKALKHWWERKFGMPFDKMASNDIMLKICKWALDTLKAEKIPGYTVLERLHDVRTLLAEQKRHLGDYMVEMLMMEVEGLAKKQAKLDRFKELQASQACDVYLPKSTSSFWESWRGC